MSSLNTYKAASRKMGRDYYPWVTRVVMDKGGNPTIKWVPESILGSRAGAMKAPDVKWNALQDVCKKIR